MEHWRLYPTKSKKNGDLAPQKHGEIVSGTKATTKIISKLDFLINTFLKNLFKILYKKKIFDRMVSLMNEFSSPHLFCCLSQIDHEIIFSDWSWSSKRRFIEILVTIQSEIKERRISHTYFCYLRGKQGGTSMPGGSAFFSPSIV